MFEDESRIIIIQKVYKTEICTKKYPKVAQKCSRNRSPDAETDAKITNIFPEYKKLVPIV